MQMAVGRHGFHNGWFGMPNQCMGCPIHSAEWALQWKSNRIFQWSAQWEINIGIKTSALCRSSHPLQSIVVPPTSRELDLASKSQACRVKPNKVWVVKRSSFECFVWHWLPQCRRSSMKLHVKHFPLYMCCVPMLYSMTPTFQLVISGLISVRE